MPIEVFIPLEAIKRGPRSAASNAESVSCCESAETSSVFVVVKVTEACNMACTYCSAEKDLTRVPVLKFEMGKAIVDSLVALGLPSYSVCFHGGEPLLGFKAVRQTIEYALSLDQAPRFSFSIQSNLVLMTTEIASWCQQHHVSVGFSIDGEPAVNDERRVFHNGAGSTGSTLRGLEILQRHQPVTGCVAVIGPHNWDKVNSLVAFLRSNGVSRLALNRLAPVGRGVACILEQNITDDQYFEALKAAYEEMYLSGYDFQVKPIMDWAWKIVQPASRSHGCYQCGAGWSHISVDPLGNVYACDRFSFDPEWVSGNITTAALEDIMNDSRMIACRTRVSRIEPCQTCSVEYVCGGSCAVTSYYSKGTIDAPGHECGSMRMFIPWIAQRLESNPTERFALEGAMMGGVR